MENSSRWGRYSTVINTINKPVQSMNFYKIIQSISFIEKCVSSISSKIYSNNKSATK